MSGVVAINIVGNSSSAVAAIGKTNAALAGLNGAAAKANTGIAGIEKRMAGLQRVFIGLAGGFAAAKAILSVADAASELEQSVGGVEAAFASIDGGADQMLALSQNANDAGLATAEFNQIAVELGSTLNNLGIAENQVVDETQGLIDMASDLAAAFGGGTQKAAAALTSALTGQSRPLKAYAITLRQVDVNARMAAEGISEAAARISIIKEQASAFAGQADREFATYESTVNRLKAAFTDMQASLGQALLPALIATANVLKSFADVVASIPKPVADFAVKLALVAGALKATSVLMPKLVASFKALGMLLRASAFTYGPVSLASNMGRSAAEMKKANAQAAKLKSALKGIGAAAVFTGVLYALDAMKNAMDENAGSAEDYLEQLQQISDVADSLTLEPPGGAGQVSPWELASLGAAEFNSTLEAAEIASESFWDAFWNTDGPALGAWGNAGAAVESQLDAFEELLALDPAKAASGWDEYRAKLESVGYSSDRLDEIQTKVEEAAAANSQLATAAGNAATSAELQAAAYYTLADSLSEAEKRQREYLEGVTYGPQNIRAYYAAMKELKGEVSGFSKVLDGKKFDNFADGFKKLGKEAPEAQEALEGFADAAIEGAAGFSAIGDQKNAQKTVADARTEFIKAAEALGYTTDQAKAYADSLGLIPENVSTDYNITGDDAYTIQKIRDGWQAINGKVIKTYYKIEVEGYVPGKNGGSYSTSQGSAPVAAAQLAAMAEQENAAVMRAMSPVEESLRTGRSTAYLKVKVNVDDREMAGLAQSWEDVVAAAERYENQLARLTDANKDVAQLQKELDNAAKKDRKGIEKELAKAAVRAAELAKKLGIADINAKKLAKDIKSGGDNADRALKLIAKAGQQLAKAYERAEKAAAKARQVYDAVKGLYDGVRSAFDSIFDGSELTAAIANAGEIPQSFTDAFDTASDSLKDYEKQVENLLDDSRRTSWNPYERAAWQADYDQAVAGVNEFTDKVSDAQKAINKYSGDAAAAVSGTLDAQLKQAETFNQQLNDLVAAGLDPAAVNSLIGMGAEAGSELAGVLLANPALIQKYEETQAEIARLGQEQADLQAQYQLDAIKTSIEAAAEYERKYFKKNPLEISAKLNIKINKKTRKALKKLGVDVSGMAAPAPAQVTINVTADGDGEAIARKVEDAWRSIERREKGVVFA